MVDGEVELSGDLDLEYLVLGPVGVRGATGALDIGGPAYRLDGPAPLVTEHSGRRLDVGPEWARTIGSEPYGATCTQWPEASL